MPSHIFTRVGYWKDSIASNKEFARVAKEGGEQHDQAHAMDYLVYAHLQLAQDQKARAVVDELTKLEFKLERFPGPYAVAASQARYVFERGDWKTAAELQVRPTKYLYVDAISYFARAVGAARSGNPTAAKADIAKLVELRDKLKEGNDAYWSNIVDIQQQVASAWVLYAEGKYDEALNAMSAAAEAEDKTDKHPVTPGPLAPARELCGAMLLDRGNANEALAAYEAVLKKEPNRLAAYVGAAKSASAFGDGQGSRICRPDCSAHCRCRYIKARADRNTTDNEHQTLMRPRIWHYVKAALVGAIAQSVVGVSRLGATELLGQAGVLGEWELTGNLTESGQSMEFFGPLKMKHVGIGTGDGPEERAGEISLQLASRSESLTARLVLDGSPCTYYRLCPGLAEIQLE